MTAENHQDFAEAKTAPQVAIVDDESGVRQTLVRGLERHGFLCRPFRSGVDFLDSLVTQAGNGDPDADTGCAIHLYAASRSMVDRAFFCADGEWLILPQQGTLRLVTEMGAMEVEPLQVALIPRGVCFRVELIDGPARGAVKAVADSCSA